MSGYELVDAFETSDRSSEEAVGIWMADVGLSTFSEQRMELTVGMQKQDVATGDRNFTLHTQGMMHCGGALRPNFQIESLGLHGLHTCSKRCVSMLILWFFFEL